MSELDDTPHLCPFCGATNLEVAHADGDEVTIRCATGRASGPKGNSEYQATVLWNLRVNPGETYP